MSKHCQYAKSDMTPCVRRDGPICWALNSRDHPICVGCERTPMQLGLPFPRDWEKIVAEVREQDRKAAQKAARRR